MIRCPDILPQRRSWRPRGAVVLVVLCACGRADDPAVAPPPLESEAAIAGEPLPMAAGPVVVFLGDSLSAGYGLEADQAYPSHLERELAPLFEGLRIVNAGVSGDTSAGGLRRIDWLLLQEPDVVVVELGANDGLRGLPLDHTEGNLREIVGRAQSAGSRVLLLGMRVPPNYGPDYSSGFAELFPRLAAELDLAFVPFFLDGVAGRADLNLADGIHPTAAGHAILAQNVRPALQRLLDELD